MTVSSQVSSVSYLGDGVTTLMPVPFYFLEQEHLLVIRVNLDSTTQTLALGSDYSVAGAGNQAGGSVTMFAAPAIGVQILIQRSVPATQETDYVANDPFPAESHERALDKLTMLFQQNASDISKALRVQAFDPVPARVPGVAQRANLLLSFNSQGDPIVVAPASGSATDLALLLANNSDITKGAALVGYRGRTVHLRLSDIISVMDSDGANPGAAGTGGNDLVAVQHKIDQAQPLSGSVLLPTGKKFNVATKPNNPTGVPFVGDGKVGMPELGPGGVGTGFYQLNTKFDKELCIGREYLYRAWSFIHLQDGDRSTAATGGAGSDLRVYLYGDSTAVGYVNNVGPTPSPNLAPNLSPDFAIKYQLQNNGVRYTSVFQRAVSGTSWSDLNAIPDLAANTALFVIKYGINDAALPSAGLPVDQRIANMASVMRSKLAAIRAATNGGLSQLSIILVGPTATADSVNGRNEEFFEQVRNVYIQAARDFQCCYIDPYPFMRDARTGGLLWMDQPYGNTEVGNTGPRTVHMTDTSMNVLWAWIVDQAFPREALLEWGSTSFRNIGNNTADFAVEALGPLGYRAGETWQDAPMAAGFPINGRLQTLRWADGQTKQILHPFATSLSGNTGVISRTSTLSGLTFLARWTGIPEALTLVTGWVTFAVSTVPSATLGADGWVDLLGSMKSGTTSPGTLVTTLPAGMRPSTDRFFLVSTNAGVGTLTIQASGQVLIAGGGDATRMNLDGIRFKAA